jgi:hypothetical protein
MVGGAGGVEGAEPRQLLLRHASQSSLDESSQKLGGKVFLFE